MDLVEINYIHGQATKAVFDFVPDRISAQHFSHIAVGVPAQAALSEDVRPGARPSLERATNDFFRVAQAVGGGRIDPVDSEFERAVNGQACESASQRLLVLC